MYPLNQPYNSFTPITFTTASAGSVVAGPFDVSTARSMTLHITSIGNGDIVVKGSIDNVNFITIPITRLDSISSGFTGTSAGQIGSFYVNTLNFRYIQLNANTAFTTGTTTLNVAFSNSLISPTLNFAVPYVNASSGSKMQTIVSTNAVAAVTGGVAGNYNPSNVTYGVNYIVVKSGQGTISALNVSNPSTSTDAYVKIANAASTTFTSSASSVPANFNIFVKAGTTESINVGYAGIQFASGITVWIAGGAGLLDATAPPANVLVNMGWL